MVGAGGVRDSPANSWTDSLTSQAVCTPSALAGCSAHHPQSSGPPPPIFPHSCFRAHIGSGWLREQDATITISETPPLCNAL